VLGSGNFVADNHGMYVCSKTVSQVVFDPPFKHMFSAKKTKQNISLGEPWPGVSPLLWGGGGIAAGS
jgi:hypothetical protein